MSFTEIGLERYIETSAIALAAGVQDRTLSPVQLHDLVLALIEPLEPTLNAYAWFDPAVTRIEAENREAEARAGRSLGPLHGVPIAVKDTFHTAGIRTARGSNLHKDDIPAATAPAVERVLAAGAVMIGKTTMPEFGWKGTGSSPFTGVSRNPWDPALNPGGSSSGSAATLATRAVPLALGSDGGGSLRIPGAFCGVFAFKGTLGRVPVWPGSVSEMLSHAGPMTRNVADAAMLMDVLAGPDPRDPQSFLAPAVPFIERLDPPPAGLRCAFVPTLFGAAVDPAIAAVVDRAFAALREGTPWTIETPAIDWADPIDTFDTLWICSRGVGLAPQRAARAPEMDPGLVRLVDAARDYDLARYLAAMAARRDFTIQAQLFFERFDLLVLPTMPIKPFAAEAETPDPPDPDDVVPWSKWTPFTYPFNLTGQPAATLPCGWTEDGLPVGLQVVAARHQDALVLAACRAIEQALDVEQRIPAMTRQHL